MANFNFDAHGHNISARYDEKKSPNLGKKSFTAQAKCPICNKEFKAGFGMGDRYTQSEVKSTLKTNIKTHVKNIHKK